MRLCERVDALASIILYDYIIAEYIRCAIEARDALAATLPAPAEADAPRIPGSAHADSVPLVAKIASERGLPR